MSTNTTAPATIPTTFYLTEATLRRITRRAKRAGCSADDTMLDLLAGVKEYPRDTINEMLAGWGLDLPAELWARLTAHARRRYETLEDGGAIENLLVERLDAVEAAAL